MNMQFFALQCTRTD